jgi:hypothetical protein
MTARPVPQLPDEHHSGSLTFEPKLDGWRCLTFHRLNGRVALQSRQQKPLTPYFPEIVAAIVQQIPGGTVLDGELVVCREGRCDFAALQRRLSGRPSLAVAASFVAFDALTVAGRDLLDLPLVVPPTNRIDIADALCGLYARIMGTAPDIVSVAFRELGDNGVLRPGPDGRPAPAIVVTCDIRAGRTAETRLQLATAIADLLETTLAWPPRTGPYAAARRLIDHPVSTIRGQGPSGRRRGDRRPIPVR